MKIIIFEPQHEPDACQWEGEVNGAGYADCSAEMGLTNVYYGSIHLTW